MERFDLLPLQSNWSSPVKTSLYEFRHDWAHHHATVKKTDILTLDTLMGHADAKMLAQLHAHAGRKDVGHVLAAVG